MTLSEEYEQQSRWRNWASYLNKLPIKATDIILDFGCGTGQITQLLAEKCYHVFGIDNNRELLHAANQNNHSSNITFFNTNLEGDKLIELPMADGIWCSFTAAYFPNFKPILSNWLQHLKPGGWIAIVEIDDLFGHQPLSSHAQSLFQAHYKRLLDQLAYDFEMGHKLRGYMKDSGLDIILEQEINDGELSFEGPADDLVLQAWRSRLDRMLGLQKSLGNDHFQNLKKEFLSCLGNTEHTCNANVKYVIARKA